MMTNMEAREDSETNNKKDSMQILEEALLLCKFGKFHIILLIATFNSVLTVTTVNITTSYILPNAECDLNMTIMQKGLLSGMPFCGQVSVCLFTGFITDTFGRRTSLIFGSFGIFICTLLEGSSQSYIMMLLAKLLQGIFISFNHGTTMVMLIESTSKDIRDRLMIFFGAVTSISNVLSVLLTWALLPQQWHIVVWEGLFELHSWNIYIYICSIWSLMTGVLYYYLPESPKFLVNHGQENEALEILKKIYSTNTGHSRNTFPIKSLNTAGEYKPTCKDGFRKQIVNGLFEMKALFKRSLAIHLLQFSITVFIFVGLLSTIKMWFPQISTIVDNYQLKHNETQRFCVMINEYTDGLNNHHVIISNATRQEVCVQQNSGSNTYINGIILGTTSLLFNSVNGYLVSYVGQKILMFASLLLCAVSTGCLYWTNSSIQIALLLASSFSFLHTVINLQRSIIVGVFPTTLRTTTMTIILTVGRLGSLSGNVLFPIALQMGCMIPFWTTSALTLGVASMVYFLPDPQE